MINFQKKHAVVLFSAVAIAVMVGVLAAPVGAHAQDVPSVLITSPIAGQSFNTGQSIHATWQGQNVPPPPGSSATFILYKGNDQVGRWFFVANGDSLLLSPALPSGSDYSLALDIFIESTQSYVSARTRNFSVASVGTSDWLHVGARIRASDDATVFSTIPWGGGTPGGPGSDGSRKAGDPGVIKGLFTTALSPLFGTKTFALVDFNSYVDGYVAITELAPVVDLTPPSLALTSPSGGEKWTRGSTQTVTWTSKNIPATNRVTLIARYVGVGGSGNVGVSTNTGVSGNTGAPGYQSYHDYILASNTPNDGTEHITVSPTLPAGSYYAGVRAIINGTSIDTWSPAPFMIIVPSITITSPAKNSVWQSGTTQTIRWTMKDIDPTHYLGFQIMDSSGRVVVEGTVLASEGHLVWNIPANTPAGSYSVRLTDNEAVPAVSSNSVSFVIRVSLSLCSPQTQTIARGGTATLTLVGGFPASYDVYSPGAIPSFTHVIGNGAAVSFTYSPTSSAPSYAVTVNTVSGGAHGTITGTSVCTVTVGNVGTPSITVVSPNGGEMWAQGSTHTITWTSANVSTNISIVARSSLNQDWTIAANIPNTGSYNWTIAGLASGSYSIRVFPITLGAVGDISDAPFTITLATTTAPALTVTADPGQAPSDQLVMGSTGNELARFRFTETGNVEDVKITDLNVFQDVSSTNGIVPKSSFQNLSLYNGATLVGTTGSATQSVIQTGYIYQFHFPTPVTIPQASSLSLVLKGDVGSYQSSSTSDNSIHRFRIWVSPDTINNSPAKAVVALGATSNSSANVTINNASGYPMTVLRSKLDFAATPLGTLVGRTKSSADNLAQLTFTASAAGDVAVNGIVITFSGTAVPASSTAFLDSIKLIDNNTGLSVGIPSPNVCGGPSGVCSKTFYFGSGSSGLAIARGFSSGLTLRIDSTQTALAQANVAQTLSATINAVGDIRFTDALDGAAVTNIPLAAKYAVPINLNSVSYSVGAFMDHSSFMASVLEFLKSFLSGVQGQGNR